MKTVFSALILSTLALMPAQHAAAEEANALLTKVNEALAERGAETQGCESGELKVCIQQGGDHDTMLACSTKVLEILNTQLAAQRVKNIDNAKRMEKDQKAVGLTPPEMVKAEEAANKAFDAYLKSECDRQVSYLAGGALTPDRLAVCQIDLLTKELGLLKRHPNRAQTN